MGIVIFAIAFNLFWKRIKQEKGKTVLMLLGALGFYIIFSIILNIYLESVYHWKYGVPGADLSIHFEGAKAIVNGMPIYKLSRISTRYIISINNFGYIAYAYMIAFVVFMPTIISVQFSLQLLYVIQAIVAICAMLNIADFFVKSNKKNRNILCIILLSCTAVLQMSAVLMRDIWIVFFISLLMKNVQKHKVNHIFCSILILLSTLLRIYSLLITVPIYIAYALKKEKTAVITSISFLGIFFVSQPLIDYFAKIFFVFWEYSYNFDIVEMVKYIFFPNIVSQSYNVMHMKNTYHAIFGGNTEWIYFMLSCWNVYIMPLAILGGVQCIRKKQFKQIGLWGVIFINIAMLYGVFYGSVSEPRHKLMIIYPLAFLVSVGIEEMSQRRRVLYFIFVTLIILLIFALAS